MSKATETTEQKPTKVAKKESSGLIVPDNLANMFVEDAGAGQAGVSMEHLALPFIRMIQNGSPERKKTNAKYIEGSEEGDIFNTVTRELYKQDKGIFVVPCAFEFAYLEFIPIDDGGGFVGKLDPNNPVIRQAVRDDNNKDMLPNGHELVKSAQHYVYVVDQETGSYQQAILGMQSTSLKVSRGWNTQIKMQTARIDNRLIKLPSFGTIWHLSTVEKTRDSYTWCEWSVLGRTSYVQDEQLYEEAKTFSELIESGEVETAADTELQSAGNSQSSTQSDDEELFTME